MAQRRVLVFLAVLSLGVATIALSGMAGAGPLASAAALGETNSLAQYSIALPLISRNYRFVPEGGILDRFDNPNSGWPVADEETYSSSYTNGEYRFLVKQADSGGYAYHPTFRCVDCDIEVDARFCSPNIGVYGLAFGVTEAQDAGYLFAIRFDETGQRGYYQLWKAVEDLPDDPFYEEASDYIRGGQSTNKLRVVRVGEEIRLYVNGHQVSPPGLADDELIGNFGVGLVAGAEDLPNVEVCYDNFYAAPVQPGS